MMPYHEAGITYMPFSDKQLEELEEAAKSRRLLEISAKVRGSDKTTYTFRVEIGSFRDKDDLYGDEDYSYYEELWGDSSLLVYIDVNGDSWSHGTAEKISDLISMGARAFVASAFNVSASGKEKRKKRGKDMNNTRLVYIEVSRLHPHPDNPRKDLGDLTELAESIRQSGIMQNLTVVPIEGQPEDYTIVIGHRRHGAAKLAGLTLLPCIVTDMDEKEQLATMMLENMQRTDLTIYEQAEGFQLMMDLGESVESIAAKTGISKTTVRNRVKLTRYDREVMREAATRQPTMGQYMRLSEIEDVSVANNVARFLGTKNFDAEVDRAIRQQRENKATEAAKELIVAFATKVSDASYEAIQKAGLVTVCSLYPPYEGLKAKLQKLAKAGLEYFYSYGYGFTIYRKKTQDDASAEEAKKAKARAKEELARRANDIHQAMVERADSFVEGYHCKGKHDAEILRQWVLRMAVKDAFAPNNIDDVAEALGWKKPENYCSWQDKEQPREYVLCAYEKDENRTMLMLLWYGSERRSDRACFLPYNGHALSRSDAAADIWMERLMLLEELGYNVSNEEWAFLNGTHPIYSEEVPV